MTQSLNGTETDQRRAFSFKLLKAENNDKTTEMYHIFILLKRVGTYSKCVFRINEFKKF